MNVAREYLQDSLDTSLHTTNTLQPSEVPEMITPTQVNYKNPLFCLSIHIIKF